jgi:hypothetical protein
LVSSVNPEDISKRLPSILFSQTTEYDLSIISPSSQKINKNA